MPILRIVLIALTLLIFSICTYALFDSRHGGAQFVAFVLMVILAANAYYLAFHDDRLFSLPETRMARLWRLWMEAKEAELARRAKEKD
jgi:hypothetical protein